MRQHGRVPVVVIPYVTGWMLELSDQGKMPRQKVCSKHRACGSLADMLLLRKLDPKDSELELVRKPPKVSRGCGGVARAALSPRGPGEANGCRGSAISRYIN